jgi:hypothetical protein
MCTRTCRTCVCWSRLLIFDNTKAFPSYTRPPRNKSASCSDFLQPQRTTALPTLQPTMPDDPPPKLNKYFQAALLDPAARMSAVQHTTYPTSNPLLLASLPSSNIKLTIGSTPTQRVWYLPKALLARHSTTLAHLCADTEITLSDIDAHAFANFVDYMRSNIYTLNPHVASFHPIRSHIYAAILGVDLGAREYADAAVRKMYMALEPAARLVKGRGMRKCIVTPEIVALVCGTNGDVGANLKKLVCDAVAASWKVNDVSMLTSGRIEGWNTVFEQHAVFRETMRKSLGTSDRERSKLLKPVDKYLTKTTKLMRKDKKKEVRVEKEVVSDSEEEHETRQSRNCTTISEQRRRILTPRMRFQGARRRMARAEAERVDVGMEDSMSAGIAPGEREASAAEDWMLVDPERVKDVDKHEFA